jgi:hypothetical protein
VQKYRKSKCFELIDDEKQKEKHAATQFFSSLLEAISKQSLKRLMVICGWALTSVYFASMA